MHAHTRAVQQVCSLSRKLHRVPCALCCAPYVQVMKDLVTAAQQLGIDPDRPEAAPKPHPSNSRPGLLEVEESDGGPRVLRDHRPLMMNVDDFLRTAAIPKGEYTNFRHLPGVVVNPYTGKQSQLRVRHHFNEISIHVEMK